MCSFMTRNPSVRIEMTSPKTRRTSANACGLPSDAVMILTVAVSAMASSATDTMQDCSGPTPNASRGKTCAITDSSAVCFWTLKGVMTGPVSCAGQQMSPCAHYIKRCLCSCEHPTHSIPQPARLRRRTNLAICPAVRSLLAIVWTWRQLWVDGKRLEFNPHAELHVKKSMPDVGVGT